jgi:hypothetical protein
MQTVAVATILKLGHRDRPTGDVIGADRKKAAAEGQFNCETARGFFNAAEKSAAW